MTFAVPLSLSSHSFACLKETFMYTHYSFSVVFFHEMCLLVKILEKRIEKDIRFDEKEQSKNNQKWEVCTFSVFARLFGNRTNLQTAIFFLCKYVLVHSICLFWFRVEAKEDMRSEESCLKHFVEGLWPMCVTWWVTTVEKIGWPWSLEWFSTLQSFPS